MTIGERIKNRRIELGYSVEQLAEKLGKNRATIYRYENGSIEDLPTQVLEDVAKALKISPAELMGWTDSVRFNAQNYFDSITPATTETYPLLGEVACGQPIVANPEYETYSNGHRINADAVVKARGDSMIGARIYDGDIVYIKFQETVENGQIAAVILESIESDDSEIVLKRFYKYGDDLVVLRSENPSYTDIEIREQDHRSVRIIGKAVAFQSELI